MKWSLLLLLIVFLVAGCDGRPTELERTASSLKLGMNKGEVKQLFADFHLSGETNAVFEIQSATKFYSTNKQCSSMIVYGSKHLLSLEMCAIYFDTNDVVIAHYYNLND